MTLTFTIPGLPQPKERARRGKDGRFYTPKRTRKYEEHVRDVARAARDDAGIPCAIEGRWEVCMLIYFPDNRRRDADNVEKAVLDGCNKVLWTDDTFVKKTTKEVMQVDKKRPRVEMTVTWREP